jgi:hypothetical protein
MVLWPWASALLPYSPHPQHCLTHTLHLLIQILKAEKRMAHH